MNDELGPPFSAPLWLTNPHLQTLGAALPFWARAPGTQGGSVEEIPIALPGPDGGALKAHAWWQSDVGAEPPLTVLLVHGVGGSAESRYMVRAASAMHAAGFHVVSLNLRGAGESVVSAPKLYHAGLTEDARLALALLARRSRVGKIALLGFSLGGNMLLKLAGEWGAAAPKSVLGVVTVSAPLDLAAVATDLERLRNFPYRFYVLRALVRQATAFARLHPARAHYRPRQLRRLRTIRQYDDLVVARMHGFDGAGDYYRQVSSGAYLPSIVVPTLMLHAQDDPMVPESTVRPALAKLSPAVQFLWTRQGGHVGWFADLGESSWIDTWPMKRAVDFLRARVQSEGAAR